MPENQENPQANSEDEKQKNKPDQDIYGRYHRNNQKKLGLLAKTVGAVGIAAAAVYPTVRYNTTGDVFQAPKDAVNVAKLVKDKVTEDDNGSAYTNQVGEAAQVQKVEQNAESDISQSKRLSNIYSEFVTELKAHPASSIMSGLPSNLEGYRVSIDDTVYRFMNTKDQSAEKTITIDDDEKTVNLTINGEKIEQNIIYKGKNKQELQESPTIEETITQLTSAFNKWRVYKQTATPDRTFPTPTPAPFRTPGHFDRTNHEA